MADGVSRKKWRHHRRGHVMLSFALNRSKKVRLERVMIVVLCTMLTMSVLRILYVPATPLDICPLVPRDLSGKVEVDMDPLTYFNDEVIAKRNPMLGGGGRYTPSSCRSRHKVAIIVPYRDRKPHLNLFLNHMHPILQRQQLDYGIYVVEQASPKRFNKAQLMNIGFLEASKIYDYDCFIFHDVDLMPEDDRIMYTCSHTVLKHLSVAISKWDYKVKFDYIFGGVTAFNRDDYLKLNGFSNRFWGWGGEDDNMFLRSIKTGLKIHKLPADLAHYKMVEHKIDSGNPLNPSRHQLVTDAINNYSEEGVNSVDYTVVNIVMRNLYTWINVNLNDDHHYMLRVQD